MQFFWALLEWIMAWSWFELGKRYKARSITGELGFHYPEAVGNSALFSEHTWRQTEGDREWGTHGWGRGRKWGLLWRHCVIKWRWRQLLALLAAPLVYFLVTKVCILTVKNPHLMDCLTCRVRILWNNAPSPSQRNSPLRAGSPCCNCFCALSTLHLFINREKIKWYILRFIYNLWSLWIKNKNKKTTYVGLGLPGWVSG